MAHISSENLTKNAMNRLTLIELEQVASIWCAGSPILTRSIFLCTLSMLDLAHMVALSYYIYWCAVVSRTTWGDSFGAVEIDFLNEPR